MRLWSLAVAVAFLGCAGARPPTFANADVQLDPAAERIALGEPAEASPPDFVLHVADVGTGLAVLVEGADFTLVYDAGSNDDVKVGPNNRFLSYLKAVKPRLRRIDHVVLSHAHRDHVELLPDVVSTYAVRHVWDSGAINPMCGYRRFLQEVSQKDGALYHSGVRGPGAHRLEFGAQVCGLPSAVTVTHGSRLQEGGLVPLGRGAKMTFLHVDGQRHGDDFNKNSLVTMLDLGGARVLLMGDAEAGERAAPATPPTRGSIEGSLLSRYGQNLASVVLIVGHHGSLSSSRDSFVRAVSPKISVISAGPTKYHGVVLPDPEVVAALERTSKVFRTDVGDGACRTNPAKVGVDNDGEAGGCDNVRVEFRAGRAAASYARIAD